jgi:hypothetical protein
VIIDEALVALEMIARKKSVDDFLRLVVNLPKIGKVSLIF